MFEQPLELPALLAAFHDKVPDTSISAQRVAFGTSGHRGSSTATTFNEAHVVAITQAICEHRSNAGIDGPLFLGIDTHALSQPAYECALEVLAANGVSVLVSGVTEYTPTPAVSHAILQYNRERSKGLADGIVMSPSHNPPADGGLKYNPPHGGPADTDITRSIEEIANRLLETGLQEIKRTPFEQARHAATTRNYSFLERYVEDLANVIDFDVIRSSGLRIGVDPMGGAGVDYWPRIAEHYHIELDILRSDVDKTFSFMSVDWDGKIRMDPSSAHAMKPLIAERERFDIAFACDTDHDRHGIVTPDGGLVPANDYLAVAIDYLVQNREGWSNTAGIGKTLVSSAMIDRVVAMHNRRLVEVPVGFKWFVDGLMDGSFCFVGEESAGATLVRKDGTVWTTDKDGIALALLSAEITARTGENPTARYAKLAEKLGAPSSKRVEANATAEQKKRLSKLSKADVANTELAGEPIEQILDRAPGNNAPIGGIKVVTKNAWFAARPSGTESIYKIYAESFLGAAHLDVLVREAQELVDRALGN